MTLNPTAGSLSILDQRWILFVKVAELGCLTQAAHALKVLPAAISRQIAQLEVDCGGRLFRRAGPGMVLSEFGVLIYQRMRPLTTEVDQLVDDIAASASVAVGDVHVGVLPSTVPMFASKLCLIVQRRFPWVRLHLVEGASAQLEEWLGAGRLDLALLLRERPLKNLQEPCLLSLPLNLIGLADDPVIRRGQIAFAALEELPLILPSQRDVLRRRLDFLAYERGMQLTVALEADTIELQRATSATGIGYAIFASMDVNVSGLPRLGAARIVHPELTRHIVLHATQHRAHTVATRSIASAIRSLFVRDVPGQADWPRVEGQSKHLT